MNEQSSNLKSISPEPDFPLIQRCFNSNWQIYQKILELNYMEHREIYASVRQYVTSHYPQPFSLLELGCGDASSLVKTFSGTALQSYIGIDLSQTGLDIAAHNLTALNITVELKQQEMLEFLTTCSSKFDLILISFALHHFLSEQKQVLLQQCWNHLNSGGTLLLIDVFCRDHESREDYLNRYCHYIQTEWQGLPLESRVTVTDHIRSSDFPDSEATLRHWAQENGFSRVEQLYRGSQEVHQAFALG